MDEYIERKALLDKLKERDLCLCVTEQDIKDAPAADVAPVVHGKWILVDTEKGIGVCSNCNRQDRIDHLATHCRFCGARMDLEVSDGKS